jgi:calcium/calmodulin-dependent protein kinase I
MTSIVQQTPQINLQGYSLGRTIGTGTFAVVRDARRSGSADPLVVKSISLLNPDTKKPDPKQKLFVEREVATMLQLNGHPNFAKLVDVVEETKLNTIHLIQEQVTDAVELFDLLKNQESGHVSEHVVKRIAFQLFSALEFAHSRGVLHRDIKLDNVLVQPEKDYNVTIIDFGLATLFSDASVLTEAVGCIHYASPSILLAASQNQTYRHENGWLDVWSSGVLTFGLLQGLFPFKQTNPAKLLREIMMTSEMHPQHKTLGFKTFDDVSADATNLVRFILNPDQRPTAKEVLSQPWFDSVREQVNLEKVEPLMQEVPMSVTDLDWRVQLQAVQRYRICLQNGRAQLKSRLSIDTVYESETESSNGTVRSSSPPPIARVASNVSSRSVCRGCWEEAMPDGSVVVKKPNPVNLFKKWLKIKKSSSSAVAA